jgi:endonuclease III
MSQAFGVPAFPVDTHIHRLAYRWTLSTGKSVERTEADLKKLLSREHMERSALAHHLLRQRALPGESGTIQGSARSVV